MRDSSPLLAPCAAAARLAAYFWAAVLFSSHILALPVVAEGSELRITPIVRAVQGARQSVVNIQGQKTVSEVTPAGALGGPREVSGMGTGVVIDPRGYILTNQHVVAGVRRINVTFDGGRMLVAHMVAHDEETDLAIIKVRAPEPLPVIRIGRSDDLMTGEPVIALGNAYGYEHTVTRGIISALNRDVQVTDTQSYDDLIQTDASINPGNSGGPLLNIDGEMIGVNVAVRAGAQGIGFAIPVDKAMQVSATLMSIERLEKRFHGITMQMTSDRRQPLVVREVRSGSPAASCGLAAGDVITSVGSVHVDRQLDVERALLGRRGDEVVPVEVLREGQSVTLDLVLASPATRVTPVTVAAEEPSRSSVHDERTWEMLGMDLTPEPSSTFRNNRSRYRGGMRVVDVRAGGPAEAQGIMPGDVLVGMHRWETASDQDVDYIVRRANMGDLGSVRFYVMREGETLYGQMNVASSRGSTSPR